MGQAHIQGEERGASVWGYHPTHLDSEGRLPSVSRRLVDVYAQEGDRPLLRLDQHSTLERAAYGGRRQRAQSQATGGAKLRRSVHDLPRRAGIARDTCRAYTGSG